MIEECRSGHWTMKSTCMRCCAQRQLNATLSVLRSSKQAIRINSYTAGHLLMKDLSVTPRPQAAQYNIITSSMHRHREFGKTSPGSSVSRGFLISRYGASHPLIRHEKGSLRPVTNRFTVTRGSVLCYQLSVPAMRVLI